MPTLLFVYNADGGWFNALTDTAHKLLSPSTYSCNLCKLTHGVFGARDEWKRFLAELKLPVEFLHRDEFNQLTNAPRCALPAIFRKHADGRIEPWIDAERINAVTSVEELMRLIASQRSPSDA